MTQTVESKPARKTKETIPKAESPYLTALAAWAEAARPSMIAEWVATAAEEADPNLSVKSAFKARKAVEKMFARWLKAGLVEDATSGYKGEFRCQPAVGYAALASAPGPLLQQLLAATQRPEWQRAFAFRTQPFQHDYWVHLAQARLRLYCEPSEVASTLLLARNLIPQLRSRDERSPLRELLGPRAPAGAFQRLGPDLQGPVLQETLRQALEIGVLPDKEVLDLAWTMESPHRPVLRSFVAALCALGPGATEAQEQELLSIGTPLALQSAALLALARGDGDVALSRTRILQAIHAAPRTKRKTPPLEGPLSPLLAFVLATGTPEHAALAREQISRLPKKRRAPYIYTARFLGSDNDIPVAGWEPDPCLAYTWQVLGLLLPAFHLRDADNGLAQEASQAAKSLGRQGLRWLQAQAALLGRYHKDPKAYSAPEARTGLLGLRRPEAPWEIALNQLEALPLQLGLQDSADKTPPKERLAFLIKIYDPASSRHAWHDDIWTEDAVANEDSGAIYLQIEARLQSERSRGEWTPGRAVSAKKLIEQRSTMSGFGEEDARVIATIRPHAGHGRSGADFSSRTPVALSGHPRVFWKDAPDGPPVEVVLQRPRLSVQNHRDGLRLMMQPVPNAAGIGIMQDGPSRLVVAEYSTNEQAIQRVVAQTPLIPEQGKARVQQLAARLASRFSVHSQLALDSTAAGVKTVAPDSRPVVQLYRADPGLRARVSVMPLGPDGPSLRPGHGSIVVVADINATRTHCERAPQAEMAALNVLLEACPDLAGADLQPYCCQTLEACLVLLQTLGQCEDDIVVRWPEGRPLSVVAEASLDSLRLQVSERGAWLAVQGTIAAAEDAVLDVMEVLERPDQESQFVAVGEDRFVALAPDLLKNLQAIGSVATGQDNGSGKAGRQPNELRIPPISLGFLGSFFRDLGHAKLNKAARERLAKIEAVYASSPEVPKTLDAELREYQVTGFQFLSRLAQIGAGACLADDMGLGKTLMTLALLLSRAPLGPALIVAPTSLRTNWVNEALRFAAPLRLQPFDAASESAVSKLGPFDVLVCSYTLAAQRIEALEQVGWATLVLDEAQAIKNLAAQRTQAVRRLQAQARVALTGTPVENHLGDLYSIVTFLNPGLLGTPRQFEQRFGKPIQRDGDSLARARLRAIIAPFVLRRRKAEVLAELPPRTEITIEVEPGPEEQAFCEALRRDSLKRLHADSPEGLSAINVLAAITRLRRAACSPQLIDPDSTAGTAKLDRVVELALSLREGGHRALLFSQFVDFLRLAQARLQAAGMTCQYLDGRTREADRHKAVEAFQAGHSDLFLISLKAGGFGLNLTAADYVIHLDPWWNPAAEAQASDRAHRIGQTRPVTIYRLVNVGSIEHLVLRMHAAKRALAEEILADTDKPERLDAKALMGLLEDL